MQKIHQKFTSIPHRFITLISAIIFSNLGFAELSKTETETKNQIFENLRHEFIQTYSETVKAKHQINLVIKLDDEVKNYFGGMSSDHEKMEIQMGSEFHLQEGVTIELYAFILCHELGHLLGGAPFSDHTETHIRRHSNEMQSDYWAAKVCLPHFLTKMPSKKNLLENLDNTNIVSVSKECQGQQMCIRVIDAGFDFFKYLKIMYKEYQVEFKIPKIETPEAPAEKDTKSKYPSFQCRLDTIVSGALGNEKPLCW